ncbi:hypothetical protein I6A60_40300 [Frankia sp. AgB1.9]|uniref:hypothetical protein n=1 Tax=Frankia sp. AgB1.9 TaxID=1836968 RepID=UPI0019334DFB|nr:hypothetical protein [Frankia sp. AgB1.9]MBL7486516.1 hypothetical protein [Frankia sp. AgW1.1]MBL7554025.1 hypothetical protein [Frankia sp. AgB1.9]MBL7618209.1 hypothetical protein [Frankia sp. AgB1.8]
MASLVPLTVWPTPTATTPGVLSPGVAARLIATFSKPGDRVLALDGPAGYADAAGYLHRPYTARPAAAVLAGDTPTGPVGLVIDHPPAAPAEQLLARFATVARLLTGGGFLACVHPPAAGPRDPLATAIGAGEAAGLRYLQHLVALAVPIRHGTLTPPRDATTGGLLTAVHTDVAVFTTPGGDRA